MRIWYIPYGYLDYRRLASQHYEVHGLTTIILKDGNWGSIAEYHRQHGDYLMRTHEACVREMDRRKGEKRHHDTPLNPDILQRTEAFKPTRDQLIQDVTQLRSKWEMEGYLHGVGRLDLRKAEEQLGLPIGRELKECLVNQAQTKQIIKNNKGEWTKLKGTSGVRLQQLLKLIS